MQNDALVHVIDDDDAVRQSLAFLFKTVKLPAAAYPDAGTFLNALSQIHGGCVVTDVRMPGMSGIDLLKRLRELKNPIPVVVITGHADVPLAVEAMKHGAVDFLEKPFDDDLLLRAVRTALRDQDSEREHRAVRAAIEERLTNLTPRERQVLNGLVVGHPNKTIAYDLNISPRTVEIYRANVMTKMDANSLSDLVRMALNAGLLGVPK
jgi:two-component system response regulator FixJ